MSVQCPWCGKRISTYSPAGGDGSGLVLRWHVNLNTRSRCDGSKADVTDLASQVGEPGT